MQEHIHLLQGFSVLISFSTKNGTAMEKGKALSSPAL
jgi:hypothetical protein